MPANTLEDKSTSIHITYRHDRSISTFLLHKFLRPLRSQLLKFEDPLPPESQQVKIPKKAKTLCHVEERRIDNVYIYDFTARQEAITVSKEKTSNTKKRIYYFSGGGWQIPASSQHVFMLAGLASRMPGTTVSLISYPLAPKCPAPKCFPLLCDLYLKLMSESAKANETVIIAGDSAGGNIALCLPLHILNEDAQAPAPAAIMVIAPSTDLRRCNPKIDEVARNDPLLTVPFIKGTADTWRGDWESFDARVSPLAADLGALAKRGVAIHGAYGTYDILSPDAILFRERCAEIGIKGRWLEWGKQMHVWLLTARYGLPEAKQGVDWMANVLRGVEKQATSI